MLRVMELEVTVRRRRLLQEVSLSAPRGVTAVIGVNGAGKTTLFRALAGLVPAQGSVTLDGKPVPSGAARYAPQFAPVVNSLTVEGLLGYLAALDGVGRAERGSRVAWVLERCGLEGVRRTRLGAISGGEAKRFLIAQALLKDSPVLLLDEPTSGLDPVQKRGAGEVIAELGDDRIVLFSSHDMAEVREIATNFVALRSGSVVLAGRVSDLTPSIVEDVIGVKL